MSTIRACTGLENYNQGFGVEHNSVFKLDRDQRGNQCSGRVSEVFSVELLSRLPSAAWNFVICAFIYVRCVVGSIRTRDLGLLQSFLAQHRAPGTDIFGI